MRDFDPTASEFISTGYLTYSRPGFGVRYHDPISAVVAAVAPEVLGGAVAADVVGGAVAADVVGGAAAADVAGAAFTGGGATAGGGALGGAADYAGAAAANGGAGGFGGAGYGAGGFGGGGFGGAGVTNPFDMSGFGAGNSAFDGSGAMTQDGYGGGLMSNGMPSSMNMSDLMNGAKSMMGGGQQGRGNQQRPGGQQGNGQQGGGNNYYNGGGNNNLGVEGLIGQASGGIRGANAAQKAAGILSDASDSATNQQTAFYNQNRGDLSPYMNNGSTALNSMMGKFADGSLGGQFTGADYLANRDPGYQFQLDQGNQALQNSQAAHDGVMSGAAMKGMMSYNQGMASTGYQNAYNRWLSSQGNTYNQLSGVANMGANAAGQITAAGQKYSTGIAGSVTDAGSARASGVMGYANAMNNGVQGLAQASGMTGPGSMLGGAAQSAIGGIGNAIGSAFGGNSNSSAQPTDMSGWQYGQDQNNGTALGPNGEGGAGGSMGGAGDFGMMQQQNNQNNSYSNEGNNYPMQNPNAQYQAKDMQYQDPFSQYPNPSVQGQSTDPNAVNMSSLLTMGNGYSGVPDFGAGGQNPFAQNQNPTQQGQSFDPSAFNPSNYFA